MRSADLVIFMCRLPRNYGSLNLLEPYEPIWARNREFIEDDNADCHVPAHCFPYQYVYYVIDQMYSNQDKPANKLTYTSLGQSH